MILSFRLSRGMRLAILISGIVLYFISSHGPVCERVQAQANLNPSNVSLQSGLFIKDAAGVGIAGGGAMVTIPSSINQLVIRVQFESDHDGNDNSRRVLLYKPTSNNTDCSHSLCWENPRVLSLLGLQEDHLQRSVYPRFLVTSWRRTPESGNARDGVSDGSCQVEQVVTSGKTGIKIIFKASNNSGSTTVTILPE